MEEEKKISLAVSTGWVPVSSAEAVCLDMLARADACEELAHYLYKLGDTKEALERMTEAEGLRRRAGPKMKRQPTSNIQLSHGRAKP